MNRVQNHENPRVDFPIYLLFVVVYHPLLKVGILDDNIIFHYSEGIKK